jgi:hypothetical protein
MRLLTKPLPTSSALAAWLTLRVSATFKKADSISVEMGRCCRSAEFIVLELKTIGSH